MGEWVSVKDRLPSRNTQCVVAISHQSYPTEWRESWFDGDRFRCPYPPLPDEARQPFRNVTHWREIEDLPPEPKTTVREALKEAIAQFDVLQRNGFVTTDHCFVISDAISRSVFGETLPRLRAALESEE